MRFFCLTVFVLTYSNGGDFYEAMKIGRAMRALELGSTVPMKDSQGKPSCNHAVLVEPQNPDNCICASACFFIHIGGISRSGRAFLGVHRPYFAKGKFGKLSMQNAQIEFDRLQNEARKYMVEMGVPAHVQEDVLGTSSDKLIVLDDMTVSTYFTQDLPYRYEWLKNKCAVLTDAEAAHYKNYLIKSGQVGYSASQLSPKEKEYISYLSANFREGMDCKVEQIMKSREAAFHKYFNVPSNISRSNN